jgi:hypothetical protein
MANLIITTSSSISGENALNHVPRTVTIIDDGAVLGIFLRKDVLNGQKICLRIVG